ncbi:MAG TPA: response regulator [Candidatus Methylomirabilis sp.]|nr:response regulator [Candidatus Methylomirabilis sp.]
MHPIHPPDRARASAECVPPGSATILVVEDDPPVRLILAKRLRAVGYVVEAARDGREGLAIGRRVRPDVILTDWVMPEMDGVALIRALRADGALRRAYVILLTSRDASSDRIAGLDHGADEYLVKPWSDEELLARVRAGLRIQRLQRELGAVEHKAALLTMAATLGHEINNPLTVLSAALQIAQNSPPSGAELLDLLKRCEGQVERIARVVAALRRLDDPSVTTYLGGTKMLNLHPGDRPSGA